MKIERRQIKDLKVALKDLETVVKNPKWLHSGREMENFNLLPREAWANWLLSAVLQHVHGERITFSEDTDGDGFIMDKETGNAFPVEHVAAMDFPGNKKIPKGEARIIQAIEKKIAKGAAYAKGKYLVVFFDGAGAWHRNKIRETIRDKHSFQGIYLIGLIEINGNGHSYSITQLHENDSTTYKVQIRPDFDNWDVELMR